MSIDEIKKLAEIQHGQKAKKYHYIKSGDAIGVGPNNGFIINVRKQEYISQILNKYISNEKNIQNFDEFIILCDGQNGVIITSESDIDDIKEGLQHYSFNKPCRVAILWFNDQLKCSEFKLGPC